METDTWHIPELDRSGLRKFGITTGAMVVALFGLLFPWLLEVDYPRWPWVLLLVLTIWGVVAPVTLRPVYRIWMRFGLLMSRVTAPLVLGIVFFGVLLPMGLVMRLFGRDPMARDLSDTTDSYRVESDKPPIESIERPF
jgi:hypothetical protein